MIDEKIKQLRAITDNFLYIEYYSHTQCDCWKIDNEFTSYNKDTIVLCPLEEGIEKALNIAIETIGKRKKEFPFPIY